jgi:hypothetical protein
MKILKTVATIIMYLSLLLISTIVPSVPLMIVVAICYVFAFELLVIQALKPVPCRIVHTQQRR